MDTSQAIIYRADPRARRIKFYIPYQRMEWRSAVKALQTSWYHREQKLWSIVNDAQLRERLIDIFGSSYEERDPQSVRRLPVAALSETHQQVLDRYVQSLCLRGYSPNTMKAYKTHFTQFLVFFDGQDIDNLTVEPIESFIYLLKTKYGISERKQSIQISAIKYYFEKVLGRPKERYLITRPKRSKTLPHVLSQADVKRLLEASKNLKHRAVLSLMYSAGLRISELPKIRIEDVNSADGYIFIRGAKQKKDRHVVLSPRLLKMLRQYYTQYRPAYWLFEGVDGGPYSVSSIRKVFRQMATRAGINPWATPHSLRHAYATHLLQAGTSLRQIQQSLGHASCKTTEIYTQVLYVNNKTMQSPLDALYDTDIRDISTPSADMQ